MGVCAIFEDDVTPTKTQTMNGMTLRHAARYDRSNGSIVLPRKTRPNLDSLYASS